MFAPAVDPVHMSKLQQWSLHADPQSMTTLGGSLFCIAVGAILAFAVTAEAEGFDINTIGVILMIVGGIGLLVSFLLEQPYGFRRRTTIVERRDDVL